MAVNTAVYVYQMTHPPATGYLPTHQEKVIHGPCLSPF